MTEDAPRKPDVVEPVELGFGLLFEASRDAIVVSDERGNIVLWNPAATRLFGYEKNEALNMNVRSLVPPRMQQMHDEGMQRYRRTHHGTYIESGIPLELPALRKDGSEITIDLVLSEVPHPTPYVLAIMRDVTDRARLRAAVEQDRRQLKSINEGLEAFSYVVSHDLKEPIRGLNFILEEGHKAATIGEKDDALVRAIETGGNMTRLVQGLLEWSRATMTPVDAETLRIQTVIQGPTCSVMYRSLMAEKGAVLKVDPDIPEILATPGLVCQIFGNLITNSFKYSDKPVPMVRIYAAPAEEAGLVDIVVEDNGPGYSDAVLTRFSTLKNKPSTIKGGFGLAITRRATERLGGSMSLSNNPAGGGRAHIRLPEPSTPSKARETTLSERVRDLV